MVNDEAIELEAPIKLWLATHLHQWKHEWLTAGEEALLLPRQTQSSLYEYRNRQDTRQTRGSNEGLLCLQGLCKCFSFAFFTLMGIDSLVRLF